MILNIIDHNEIWHSTYSVTHLVTHLVWPHGGPISTRPGALWTTISLVCAKFGSDQLSWVDMCYG